MNVFKQDQSYRTDNRSGSKFIKLKVHKVTSLNVILKMEVFNSTHDGGEKCQLKKSSHNSNLDAFGVSNKKNQTLKSQELH